MRRRLLLAVLLLAAPELLGRWFAAHAATALAASGIVTERYERGWLSSRARLRLIVRDQRLARPVSRFTAAFPTTCGHSSATAPVSRSARSRSVTRPA